MLSHKQELVHYNCYCIVFLCCNNDSIGNDFSVESISIELPANCQSHELDMFFNIIDDDLAEDEEIFGVVAEIGPDVPNEITCFRGGIVYGCFGRQGATEIRITDNDCELFFNSVQHFHSLSLEHYKHKVYIAVGMG